MPVRDGFVTLEIGRPPRRPPPLRRTPPPLPMEPVEIPREALTAEAPAPAGDVVHAELARATARAISSTESLIDRADGELFYPAIARGQKFKPADFDAIRQEALNGLPLRFYGLLDELPRLGPGPQLSKFYNGIAGAQADYLAWPEEARDEDKVDDDSKFAREVADYARRTWKPWSPRYLRAKAKAYVYGIGAAQLTTEADPDDGNREKIVGLDAIPARRFWLDRSDGQWKYLKLPRNYSSSIPIEPLIARGQLLWTAIDEDSPLDERGVGWHLLAGWGLHQWAFRWLARRLELYGIPPRWAFYDPTIAGAEAAVNAALAQMGAASFGSFPIGTQLQIGDPPASSGDRAPHLDAIEALERLYDKELLGHAQASQVQKGAGSQQSADNAQEEFFRLLDGFLEVIAWDHRRELARFLARNINDPRLAAHIPQPSFLAKRNENLLQRSQWVKNLSDAHAGQWMPAPETLRPFGIRMARPGEPTLAPPVPAAPVLPVPGAGAQRPDSSPPKTGAAPAPKQKDASAEAMERRLRALATEIVFGEGGGVPDPPAIPAGFGEEIVGPYRDILLAAKREGLSLPQSLGRVLVRMRGEWSAPEMVEVLAAVLLDATMQGLTEVQEARGEGAA